MYDASLLSGWNSDTCGIIFSERVIVLASAGTDFLFPSSSQCCEWAGGVSEELRGHYLPAGIKL